MKIGIDVMGGDFAPDATIKGALLAREQISSDDRIFLFGPQDIIETNLEKMGASRSDFTIVHSPEIVSMGERPIKAFTQKPDSSIAIGFKYLKAKK